MLEQFFAGRDQSNVGFAFEDLLGFENVEQSAENLRITSNLLQSSANDARTRRGCFGKFDGGLALGSVGDDADLVGTVLFDSRGDLAQAVHHFFLDLLDHVGVAEMNLADIDRAEPVAPFVRAR